MQRLSHIRVTPSASLGRKGGSRHHAVLVVPVIADAPGREIRKDIPGRSGRSLW
jgi:hypothetical protein